MSGPGAVGGNGSGGSRRDGGVSGSSGRQFWSFIGFLQLPLLAEKRQLTRLAMFSYQSTMWSGLCFSFSRNNSILS